VAGRQSHIRKKVWVPGIDNMSPAIRVILEGSDEVCYLVNSYLRLLPSRSIRRIVGSIVTSPLPTVARTDISRVLRRVPLIPDMVIAIRQPLLVRSTLKKPKKLGYNKAEWYLL